MPKTDQTFYDIVADELRSHSMVDGLWVRAFSEAGGDESKAKALYIQFRVDQLRVSNLDALTKAKQAERTKADLIKQLEHSERRINRQDVLIILLSILTGLILFLFGS